ncbi:MAG: hypothetical protein JST80_00270 [Bdellovibrionales bacterium]|nr:hypothetical protein [Bdellovibrionales bacterium]
MSKNKRTASLIIWVAALTAMASSCARKDPSPGLVDTTALGTVRGLHFARVQTHFHSPYSFDACDSKGLDDAGNPNTDCLHDIKKAFCTNHVNLAFLTDHVSHLADYEFPQLVLAEAGDTILYNGSAEPIATQINCSDGFKSAMAPGLEGRLLALGMEHHASPVIATRQAIYGGESSTERAQLETLSNALVGVPHTESRDLTTIQSIAPKFIEIYNVHANIDPKLRKKWLGLAPFEHIAKFLNYLVDPFNQLNADFFFMEFVQFAPVYMQRWNALLAGGMQVTGLGGLDSHENVFPQKASDGERLDGHRRMTRFMSNLVLTTADDSTTIKAAIQAGRVYFALEGIGTPAGLDFYGNQNGTIVEMGGTLTVGGQMASIIATVPTAHSSSFFMNPRNQPFIEGELHYIDASGNESVVALAKGGEQIVYNNPAAGHYRMHVYMYPLHLFDLIFSKKYASQRYQWVISNPVKVVP